MNSFDNDDFLPPPTGRNPRPAENAGSDTFENHAQSTADIPPTFESLQADHLLVEDAQNDSAQLPPIQFQVAPEPPQAAEESHKENHHDPLAAQSLTLDDLQLQDDPELTAAPQASAPKAQPTSEETQKVARGGILSKVKPIYVVALIAVALVMWNQHKKKTAAALQAQQAAAAHAQQAPTYSQSLKELQNAQGPAQQPGLPADNDPMAAFFDQGSQPTGEPFQDAGSQVSTAPNTTGTGGAATDDMHQAQQPVSVAANPPVTPSAPAPAPAPAPDKDVAAVVPTPNLDQYKEQLAAQQKTISDLQTEIAQLKEKLQSQTQPTAGEKATTSKSAAVSGGTKPAAPRVARVEQPKREVRRQAQPVSSSQAAPARPDIAFLGAFREGGEIVAHTLIGSTVYKVSSGEKIAGVRIDAVSMDGVVVNGVRYGN